MGTVSTAAAKAPLPCHPVSAFTLNTYVGSPVAAAKKQRPAAQAGQTLGGTLEGDTMSDVSGAGRFCPEVRGWAALRLGACVPEPIRHEIDRCAGPPPSNGPHGYLPTVEDFVASAVALVSLPAAILWSREIAERIPALGIAAGPACIARLLAARLLKPDSALRVYWPGIVDRTWSVIRPALEKMGVTTHGCNREDLRHEVASPLGLVFLKSLAAGRKDLRLLGIGLADRPDGPPFGWAPGIDAIGLVLRYLLAGQVPGEFRSHAFLSSPLAAVVRSAGIAAPVVVVRWRCKGCRTWAAGDGRCPQCGGALAAVRSRRLVATALLRQSEGIRSERLRPLPARALAGERFVLPVSDRAEAEAIRRRCIVSARLLWEKVVRGCSPSAPAMVTLGALADVRPLAAIADQPAAEAAWLWRLVESLAGERLDRVQLACEANKALAAVAARLGRPATAAVSAAYVGVLATRFRQAIFGSRSGRSGRDPCKAGVRW